MVICLGCSMGFTRYRPPPGTHQQPGRQVPVNVKPLLCQRRQNRMLMHEWQAGLH